MALSSSRGFAQWAYGIGRLHRARHGKMDIRRGSSVQSDGIALTMSLCSANDISAICSIPTKNITTKLGRIYRCTRTRQSHVLSRPSVARWRCQFWAGCITNISGRKFPTGTTLRSIARSCARPWRTSPPLLQNLIFGTDSDASEILCPYCSTLFCFDPSLGAHEADPADCAYGDGRADEAQQSSGPQPRSPVDNYGGQVEAGAEGEGEIARVRFVSLSP